MGFKRGMIRTGIVLGAVVGGAVFLIVLNPMLTTIVDREYNGIVGWSISFLALGLLTAIALGLFEGVRWVIEGFLKPARKPTDSSDRADP